MPQDAMIDTGIISHFLRFSNKKRRPGQFLSGLRKDLVYPRLAVLTSSY